MNKYFYLVILLITLHACKQKPNLKMNKTIISTTDAPAAIGPYSQAVLVNGTLYASGQIALDPQTGSLVNEDISTETHQVMKNISAVLKAADMGFDNIVKVTIFMKSMNDYAAINTAYAEYFGEKPPAREAVEVARLPKDVNVEISIIAVK